MIQSKPSTIAAYIHAFASALESCGIHPEAVFDEADISRKGDRAYIEFFKCPVRFECDQIKIAMISSVMDVPLPGASPELAR